MKVQEKYNLWKKKKEMEEYIGYSVKLINGGFGTIKDVVTKKKKNYYRIFNITEYSKYSYLEKITEKKLLKDKEAFILYRSYDHIVDSNGLFAELKEIS